MDRDVEEIELIAPLPSYAGIECLSCHVCFGDDGSMRWKLVKLCTTFRERDLCEFDKM